MAGSGGRELTFERITVRQKDRGWVLIGEDEGETEILVAEHLSVHGWELSLDESMTLCPGSGDRVTAEITGGHIDLRE